MANDNNIEWYVMQVMSGHELAVLSKLSAQCGSDAANVILLSEGDDPKYHAKFNGLVSDIYELNIPFRRVQERNSAGKLVEKIQRLFPGYVYIRVRLKDEKGAWLSENLSFIKDTNGVIGLLGGQKPVALTDKEVSDMMQNQEENKEEKARPAVIFNVGETVVIDEGAFLGSEGTIEAVDNEKQKLQVNIVVFGRQVPVELDFGQVRRPD